MKAIGFWLLLFSLVFRLLLHSLLNVFGGVYEMMVELINCLLCLVVCVSLVSECDKPNKEVVNVILGNLAKGGNYGINWLLVSVVASLWSRFETATT